MWQLLSKQSLVSLPWDQRMAGHLRLLKPSREVFTWRLCAHTHGICSGTRGPGRVKALSSIPLFPSEKLLFD